MSPWPIASSLFFVGVVVVNDLGEIAVKRIVDQIAVGMRHDISAVLIGLDAVTGGAVGRTDDHIDVVAVVFEGISMLFDTKTVAFIAANSDLLQFRGNV